MNFTKLYYPTAEAAADDPDFLRKVLTDDIISVDLAILPLQGPAEIIVTFLNQVLFSGQINEELLLRLDVSPIDWLWASGELIIQLINNQSEIKLTRCKLQEIDMLSYPLSELIIVKVDGQQYINTSIDLPGTMSLAITNPIYAWTTHHAPEYNLVTDLKFFDPNSYKNAETDNEQIDTFLKKLRI
jgi:hypothetical protein